MRWLVLVSILLCFPAAARVKDARPLATLLEEGAKVVAASGRNVWVDTGKDTYMCVVEVSERFRSALKRRNVRELYANWPTALCFNAGSFE